MTAPSILNTCQAVKGYEALIDYRDELDPASGDTHASASYLGRICIVEVGFAGLVVASLVEAVIRCVAALGCLAYSYIASSTSSYNFAVATFDEAVTCVGAAAVCTYALYANLASRSSLGDRITEMFRA